jgi:hypothetical protein
MPADSAALSRPPIGGFFERHELDVEGDGPSVLDAWTGGRPYAAYVNARSALAALASGADAKVWLPAFICEDAAAGLSPEQVRFYPVLDGFIPELAIVEAQAEAGDLVVLAAHFGLPLVEHARAFEMTRSDLTFVEDRAQSLAPDPRLPMGYALYSPRKVLGVADGGILVAPDAAALLPQPSASVDAETLWRAPILRLADPLGVDNAAWHAANQAKEAAMTAGSEAITSRSLDILSRTPIADLARRRLANWRALDARLGRWSALPPEPETPPLGYVLRLPPEVRRRLLTALHDRRIFAAVHWPRIAAPEADFPREHAWTRELITLPCDHRYGPTQMQQIADCVEAVLR